MAGAREVRAGRAYVELSTKDKMGRGLARAQRRLRAFGQSCQQLGTTMIGLGAAIAGPVVASLKMFSSLGDAAAKMARRTGLSVQAVQELGFAARLSGTDAASLEKGIKRMQRSIYDASRGLSTQCDALRDLGTSYKDLQGLKPEDQFTLLAEKMSKIEDASRRAALAQAFFGRAGTMLLPMFEQGAAGVAALRKRFSELGVALTDEEARAAEVFTDAMTDVWTSLKHGVAIIGSALAPSLKDLTATVVKTVREWASWIRENRELLVSYGKLALKIGAWTVGLGAALIVVGKLAFGVKGLIGVLTILAAHPVVAVIAAIGATAAATALIVRDLTKSEIDRTNAASRYRKEQDKARMAEGRYAARLEELAAKQSLSNDEMDEAEHIVRMLKRSHDSLTLGVDREKGAIVGLTGALEQLNAEQVKSRKQQILAEMARNAEIMRDLAEEQKSVMLGLINVGGAAARGLRAEVRQLEAKNRALLDILHTIDKTGAAMPTAGAGGAGAPAPGAGPMEEVRAWQKELQDEEEARRLKDLQGWKAAEAEKEAEAKRRINKMARLSMAALDEEARLKDEIARAEIEATKEGIEKRLALLKLEYRQRLEEAAMAGADLGLVKRLYDTRRRAILAGAEAAKVARRFEVRGQFGGLGAERMGGGNTAERMASGIDEIVKNTKPLRHAGSLTFG